MGGGFPAFGADAVRFTLATYPPSNKRIALAPRRIEGNRHFLNKIWNATRLALDLLGDFEWPDAETPTRGFYNRWIRSRFAEACAVAQGGLDEFRIDEAALAAYRFFWNDLCDWYLEIVKPVLRKQAEGAFLHPEMVPETRATLAYVLEGSLRILHPLMPFITEELWQRVPKPRSRKASIAFGPYPTAETEGQARDEEVDKQMETLQAVVSAARTNRSEYDVDKKADVPMLVRSGDATVVNLLRGHAEAIRFLVKTKGDPEFQGAAADRAAGFLRRSVATSHGAIDVAIGLAGLVTGEQLVARIELDKRRLRSVEEQVAALQKKLESRGFVERAKPEVVKEAQDTLATQLLVRERCKEDGEMALTLMRELGLASGTK
jgi:valyl-tRNA synthetase